MYISFIGIRMDTPHRAVFKAEEEVEVFEPDPNSDGNDGCGGCYE